LAKEVPQCIFGRNGQENVSSVLPITSTKRSSGRGEGVLPTTRIAIACCCSSPSLTDGPLGGSSPRRLQRQPMSKLSHIDAESAALLAMD
jgi:hypothetical protein